MMVGSGVFVVSGSEEVVGEVVGDVVGVLVGVTSVGVASTLLPLSAQPENAATTHNRLKDKIAGFTDKLARFEPT